MTKTRLVLFAHGSGDPRWRAPFEKLEQDMIAVLGRERLTLAYMEFVGPTLLEAAKNAAADGMEVLRVLPIFLSAGAHVAQDIPAQSEEVRRRYPGLRVEVLAPVGEDPRFGKLLREMAREAAEYTR